MSMKVPNWLKPFWRMLKPTVRQWLIERALYLSDDDLDRLAGPSMERRAAVRILYTRLKQAVLDQFDAL